MKKSKNVIIFLFIILTVFVSYYIYSYLFLCKIEFNGNEYINVEVNANYKDKGINITYRGKEVKYKESTNLDTSKLGEYEYVYQYSINDKIHYTKRYITVVDTTKPELILKGDINTILDYSQEYNEEGYTSIDSYDGELTDKVKSEIVKEKNSENYKIKYSVKDLSNNETIVYRNIIYKDLTPPEIKLKRNINSYLILGNKIDLSDFEVIDNVDTISNDKVKIDGFVDVNKEGIYKVTYTVEDSSNNKTELVTTINVQEKNTTGIPILYYHFFYDDTKGEKYDPWVADIYLAKTDFIKQIDYLVKNNYYYPTWSELEDYIDGKIQLPKKSVIITVDDGNPTYFNIAVPILNERNIPSTSFFITNKERWNTYKDTKGVIFQSHTHALHERSCKSGSKDGKAMCLTSSEILKDLKKSLEYVKNNDCLAYPFGHYDNDFIKAVKDAGIHMAVTTAGGKVKKGSDKYRLPRRYIYRTIPMSEFISKVK